MYFLFTQQTAELLVQGQTFYGAIVLSFLGGIQWGYTLVEGTDGAVPWTRLGQSVTPVLVAWIGLLLPIHATLLTLIGGHGYSLYRDISIAAYPSWFRALRFVVGLVAVVALWTTFICHISYGKVNTKNVHQDLVLVSR